MKRNTFTVHRSLLSIRYPLTVNHGQPEKVPLGPSGPFTGWLIANGKCMVNGKWLKAPKERDE